eukprot:TRINITY_DN14383_c0_g1_i1.p1 TRINITY_DN14383_c0_g1~~TRINITY_DN14383_c0_g1_i1.p1  ORF type:complete len:227 (+),score=29.12 TRINITY_DN14383_c0_g1_i1:3-683(+)
MSKKKKKSKIGHYFLTRMNNLKHILFIILLYIFIGEIKCYNMGDVVRMSLRSQYNSIFTEWKDLTNEYCPKYLFEKTVELAALEDEDYHSEAGDGYKFSFAFDNYKFITPWYSVKQGNEHLKFVDITIVYSGNDIIDIDVITDYDEVDETVKKNHLEKLMIRYNFEEFSEQNVTIGMGILLTSGVIFSSLLITLSMIKHAIILDIEYKSQKLPSLKKDGLNFGLLD